MSAKRPRPAIPVLVHVDNPTEAASVVVDTSTIEGKMDTVITNQNRIYDKIPTSAGGSSADLTTVNANTTALVTAIGAASSTSSDDNIFGHVRNLQYSVGDSTKTPSLTGNSARDLLLQIKTATGTTDSTYENIDLLGRVKNITRAVGDYNVQVSLTDTDIRSLLYNMREAIGYSSTSPTTSGTSIRNKLATIDTNTTTIKNAVGTTDSTSEAYDLLGRVKNLVLSVGDFNGGFAINGVTIRSFLYNLREAIGSGGGIPSATGTTVRDLLTAIKENTASGGSGGSADLTTVNEKTTALAAAIGSASDDSSTVSVIGLLKSITDKY